MRVMGSSPLARAGNWILRYILRAIWVATMVLVPLFGFWIASSLAAYHNASQWLCFAVGLALFPVLPVVWDLIFIYRRNRRLPERAILTALDRLVLRTLVLNGVFLIGILWFAHGTVGRALAVRGDWMLDGYEGDFVTSTRGFLLGFADKLNGRAVLERQFGDSDKPPEPSKVKQRERPKVTVSTTPPKDTTGWPLPDAADPAVTGMPEAAQADIAAVGAYLKEHFPDKKQRVKAIHDFVALRLTYDEDTLAKLTAGDYEHAPPQDAANVFTRKSAVCAGYAKLMSAIGSAAGVEILYVTGWIRDHARRVSEGTDETVRSALEGYSHAWNAVLIDDEWLLIDTTWDDPTGAKEPVRSTYLFTPPELFAYDHLPEDPAWQLRVKPMTPGDFARQPMLSPDIGRYGLSLVSPTRSQITVDSTAIIVLDNPYHAQVQAIARLDDGRKASGEQRCSVMPDTGTTQVRIACPLGAGAYELAMFAAPAGQSSGMYTYIGSILANSR